MAFLRKLHAARLRPIPLLVSLAAGWAMLLLPVSPLVAQAPPLITELGFPDGGNIPFRIAVADFNGDGIPDVAVGNLIPTPPGPSITVYLGNGDGTFKPPVYYSAGKSPEAIVAADFNGDGKMDIGLLDAENLWVLLGNGDGTFQAPVSSSLGSGVGLGSGQAETISMAVADFNGDGKPDAAVIVLETDGTGKVLLLLGNGDGTFSAPTAAVPQFGYPLAIAAPDLNGDGKPDLVLLEPYAIEVLLGDGKGGFSPQTSYPVQPSPTGSDPNALAIADLNGDGIPDLVIGISTEYDVEAYLGKGDGTFGSGIVTTLGSGRCCLISGSMGAADFNGDGHVDLFLGNPQPSITSTPNLLLLGNGDGTFQAPSQLLTAFGTDNLGVWQVAVADLNGDGRPDIVFVDTGSLLLVSVLNTPGSVGAAILPAVYDFGQHTVGTAPASTTVTIGNPGTSAMQFSNLQVGDTADFSATTTCGSSVPSGGSCSVTVTFNPQTTGEKNAAITFTTNDPLVATAKISATGDAIAPVVSTSPSVVQFSYQKVGTTSSPQTLQITNSGVGPLTLAITIQGDFQQTNNCPTSLAQGANCTVSITYTPLVPGAETGRLVMTTNAVPAQSAVALTGIGYVVGPILSISPTSLDFGSQYVGTSSAPAVVTVANNGDAPFNIASVSASAGFVPLSTCGNTVQPSFSCAIGIFFDPANTGTQTGLLTIIDNLPTSPQLVTLTGNGTEISVAASAGSSTAQSVTSGQTAQFNLSITPVSGYTGNVNLSCAGVASGFTCTLSQSSAVLSGSTPASVTVSVAPSASASIRPKGTPASRGFSGIALACPIALIFLGAGIYPRWRRRLISIGVLAVVAVSTSSCSSTSGAVPGSSQTYVFFLQSQPASGVNIETPLTMTVKQ